MFQLFIGDRQGIHFFIDFLHALDLRYPTSRHHPFPYRGTAATTEVDHRSLPCVETTILHSFSILSNLVNGQNIPSHLDYVAFMDVVRTSS